MAIFLSVNETGKKDEMALQRRPCICYPIRFKTKEIQASINLGSEDSAMTPIYASKLNVKIYLTNIEAQKIDISTLELLACIRKFFLVD